MSKPDFFDFPDIQPPPMAPAPRTAPGPVTEQEDQSGWDDLDPEWMNETPTVYLPDKTRLVLTVSRKIIYLTQFPNAILHPQNYSQAAFLIYLCANPRTRWNAPVDDIDLGLLTPLHMRPDAWKDDADAWMDRALRTVDPADIMRMACRLWVGQNANQPIAAQSQDGGADTDTKKKGIVQTLSSKLPPASPEETPPDTASLSTDAAFGSFTSSLPALSPQSE